MTVDLDKLHNLSRTRNELLIHLSKNDREAVHAKTASEAVLESMFRIIALDSAEDEAAITAELAVYRNKKGNVGRDIMTRSSLRPFYTSLLTCNDYFVKSPAVNIEWLGKNMFKPSGEVSSQC